MKNSGKKKNPSGQNNPEKMTSVNSGHSFYEQRNTEAPLDEYSEGYGQRSQRTSRHTPGRRRETSNRASQSQLVILVLKIILIPALLIAGYMVLKSVAARLAQPTEKDMEAWESSSKVMDRGPISSEILLGERVSNIDFGDAAALKERLDRLNQADLLVASAKALEQRKMEEEAISRLQEALRFAPENLAAQKLLLELNIRQGNYKEALPLCVQLLEQDGHDQQILEHFLAALHETDQVEASLLLADRILEVDPGNLRVMEIAAYDYAAKGETDKALELYGRVLQRNPDRLLALEGSGTIYEWKAEWARALPYYMKLVELDPQPERYRVLARNYAQQNEAGKAVIFLGQATGLYGESVVMPWLSDPGFDPVRQTVEFRSFADQVVGAKAREAIESIRQREASKPELLTPEGLELPSERDLEMLRPRQR